MNDERKLFIDLGNGLEVDYYSIAAIALEDKNKIIVLECGQCINIGESQAANLRKAMIDSKRIRTK